MPVLVLDYQAMYVAEKYADFLSTLTWYRMYCLARFGKSKSDYMKGFESLKDKYEFFFEFSEYDEPSWMRPSLQLIDDVEKILRTRNFSDREIGQIASIIKDFEDNREQKFRDSYFKYGIHQAAKSLYSEKLYKSVKDLLENDNYPEAVLASFKYLDMHLQTILKLSPHEYYGEELINAAFSPNSGALQLKTTQSEQIGLRNFFSGANAIFRNPTAHRFTYFEDDTAATIIAMVALMVKLINDLVSKSKQK